MDFNIFHIFFKYGITFKEVSGKSEKVTKEMTALGGEEDNLTSNIS